ncbi:interferon-inducible GTPase 5-like [Notolabrus celidotus]|uniref:interferon-inducible GTPase 5-like n=1 Tax=Notolabrus celidotus TaxID=1203425 RepID=UPI00148F88A6|nr:interferon-inducible GTPase 5-like [Notolabrus celidotus]XP_034531390.1 interferon-inducible GTPase 5-like [Notolabrus celidotus]
MGNLFSESSVDDEVKEALQKNDKASAAAKIQEYLDKEENIPLTIAVTGQSGSGKSTFVNAIRGLMDGDEGAAPTDVIETTMEVTPYPHPNFPNVTVWDLPGIGTMNYPADKYLKKVGFEKFDFFIIISADRFTENDVKLAKEIQKMKKRFYFVRSKIDENIRSEKRKKDFNEERTLGRIRENCIQGLQIQGCESPQVFLMSSNKLHLYDFPKLLKTLEGELPELKRKAFLLAMPNISLEMIDRKKEAFKSKIKYIATLSAVVASVPVPVLSIAVDLGLLVSVVTRYVFGFGLDISSLKRMANYKSVPYEELRKVIVSTLAAEKITPDLVLELLIQTASIAALMAAEEGCRCIPVLGIPASMVLSFTRIYNALNIFLNVLAEDAQRVLQKALGLNT